MTRASVISAVILASLPSTASAYCRTPAPVWDDAHPVRIVLHQSLQDEMRHLYGNGMVACTSSATCGPDGVCNRFGRCMGPRWTRAELHRAALWVASRINESGADLPIVYVDEPGGPGGITCPWIDGCGDIWGPPLDSCYQTNTILVAPENCNGTAYMAAQGNDIYSRAHRIGIPRSINHGDIANNPSLQYEHGTVRPLGNNFEMLLLHEIGHSLGLGHPQGASHWYSVCDPVSYGTPSTWCPYDPATAPPEAPSVGCAVMLSDQGRLFENHALGEDDLMGLRAIYGARSFPNARVFESSNFLAPPFYEVAASDIPVMSHLALSNWTGGTRTHLTGVARRPFLTNQGLQPFRWNFHDGATTHLPLVATTYRSHGAIGVAESATQAFVGLHVMRETTDDRRYRRRIRRLTSTLGGTAWTEVSTNPAVGAVDDTSHAGVSVAHDPTTNATLFAIRADTSEVIIVGNYLGTWSAPQSTGTYSFTTPAIACAPTECYLITVEAPRPVSPTGTTTRLMFRQFVWNQSGTVGTFNGWYQYTTGYNVTGDPMAAVVSRPSATPWELLVTVPVRWASPLATRIYMYRLVFGETIMWPLGPSTLTFPGVHVSSTA